MEGIGHLQKTNDHLDYRLVKEFSKTRMVHFLYDLVEENHSNIQGGPERSRQSNLAVFTVEGGLDAKFPYLE